MTSATETIPARRGKAAFVARGRSVKVINTHGAQVVDTWAFSRADLSEFMSVEHSRARHHHLIPRVGDALLTNRRRPILTLTRLIHGDVPQLPISLESQAASPFGLWQNPPRANR